MNDKSKFEESFDSMCIIIKPFLQKIFLELGFFIFFYFDSIERKLYFKGKDLEFESLGVDEYGDLAVDEGVVGYFWSQAQNNLENLKISYYPQITKHAKARIDDIDLAIENFFMKRDKSEKRPTSYAALLIPLMDEGEADKSYVKTVAGVGLIIFPENYNIPIQMSGDQVDGGTTCKELLLSEIISTDDHFFLRVFSDQMGRLLAPVRKSTEYFKAYYPKVLFDEVENLTEETMGEYKKRIQDTLRLVTRKGHPARVAVTEFLKKNTAMSDIVSLFERYEDILLRDKSYRDHYVHMFKVYVEGLRAVDCIGGLRGIVRGGENVADLANIWAQISLSHDFGYPVQLFEKWASQFFETFHDANEKQIGVDIAVQNILLNREFAVYLNMFADHFENNLVGEGRIPPSDAIKFFLNVLLNEKDHGLISALMYLNEIGKQVKELGARPESSPPLWYKGAIKDDRSIDVEIAFAIAMHNFAYWKFFLSNTITLWKELIISYEKTPWVFLLAYFDSIQEYGRPSGETEATLDEIKRERIQIEEKIDIISNHTIRTKLRFTKNGMDIDKHQLDLILKNPTIEHKIIQKKLSEIICFIESFTSADPFHFEFIIEGVKPESISFCSNPKCKLSYTRAEGERNRNIRWWIDSKELIEILESTLVVKANRKPILGSEIFAHYDQLRST